MYFKDWIFIYLDFGQIGIIKRLIELGCDLNIADLRLHQTALHFAGIVNNMTSSFTLLLKYYMLAISGRKDIIALLLDNGSNRLIKNKHNKMPYQLAEEQGHIECRNMLMDTPKVIDTLEVTGATNRTISLKWKDPTLTGNSGKYLYIACAEMEFV